MSGPGHADYSAATEYASWFVSATASACGCSLASCRDRGVRINAGSQSGRGQQLLGGFRHVLLLHVRHPVSGLNR